MYSFLVCLSIYGILSFLVVEIHYMNKFFLPCLCLSPSLSLLPSVSLSQSSILCGRPCLEVWICVSVYVCEEVGGLLLYCHTHHSTRCPICTSASSEWRDREKEGVRGCWCDGLQVQETKFGLGTRTVNNCSLLCGNKWIVTCVYFCSDIKRFADTNQEAAPAYCMQRVFLHIKWRNVGVRHSGCNIRTEWICEIFFF